MKNKIVSNKGISIGNQSKTLLNLLLGINNIGDLKRFDSIIANSSDKVDLITDLSLYNCKSNDCIWKTVLNQTDCMAGTVPVYLASNESNIIDKNLLIELICEQSEKGVSVITIHPTATRGLIKESRNRLIPFTSRGGGMVIKDMLLNYREENVYQEVLDNIIEVCKKNNTIISLGSTFRTATIIDALDDVYKAELKKQMEIAKYIEDKGCRVIVETPGHVPPQKIYKICQILKEYPYPIMPLGPMPTDIAFENDDMAACIGAVLMGINNCADILTIVTSQEHLGGIPTDEVIFEAIRKYNVARHIIDIDKLGDTEEDYRVSSQRAAVGSCDIRIGKECDRCGLFCPLK